MGKILEKYRGFFTKEHRRSFYVAFLILCLAIVFQYYAGEYSARSGTQSVSDLFLDNIPIVNLNLIIIEGALLAVLGTLVLVFSKTKYILFTMKAIGIFLAFRAFFIATTHLGIYPGQIIPGNGAFDQLYVFFGFETGFFFSAHTGLPFFMALIFWDERIWRYIYLVMSVVFGAAVLLAHIHYSIDVFAAPFMAFSIFKLAQYLFKDDFELLKS